MSLYTWAHIYTNKYTAIILASIFRQLFVPWRLLHFSCSPIKLCLIWPAPRDRNGTLSEMQCHRMLCWKFICFHQYWSFVALLGLHYLWSSFQDVPTEVLGFVSFGYCDFEVFVLNNSMDFRIRACGSTYFVGTLWYLSNCVLLFV